MMTLLARSETTGRLLIGALTAVYTPPHNCRFGFVESGNSDASTTTLDTIGYAYGSDCLSIRSCLPSMPTAVRRDYYSPGLYCPMGWETATKLTHGMTDSVRAINILRALSTDETAAFCCPSGFTFSYTVWSSTDALPYCASTMIEGTFTYWTCNSGGYSLEQTLRVGETVIMSTVASERLAVQATTTVVSPLNVYGRQYIHTVGHSIQDPTLVVSSAITRAPAIQLVWRSVDLPNATNDGTGNDNSPSVNTTGVLVGALVGAVVVIFAIVLVVWLWLRKKREKSAAVDENTENNEKSDDTEAKSELATGNDIAELSTAASPELPASPIAMSNSGASGSLISAMLGASTVEADSRPSVAYELDSGDERPHAVGDSVSEVNGGRASH
ncbi:hypothetical protein QBC41DRAFT_242021 [Cercophora samala]|uniref:Uncharacterized protein n=1 Tax=Cercophora samala TaxID=330535 RepID=A0AA40DG70_9PEZI|nr:hypothetical protein QBC41DRAFT_242021 [Cercophora samala]